MHISQFWAVSNSTSAMSWDYIQICALYSEIYVMVFISNSIFDCKLQSTQCTNTSPAAPTALSHVSSPGVQYPPCAIALQLSAHSPQTFPVAMLARKAHPGWAGGTICARATCQAQRGAWRCLWEGAKGSCPPAHLPWGCGHCQHCNRFVPGQGRQKSPCFWGTSVRFAF